MVSSPTAFVSGGPLTVSAAVVSPAASTSSPASVPAPSRRLSSSIEKKLLLQARLHGYLRVQDLGDGAACLGVVGGRLESLPAGARHPGRHLQVYGGDGEA